MEGAFYVAMGYRDEAAYKTAWKTLPLVEQDRMTWLWSR